MEKFVELDRRFRDLTDQEREDPALLAMWGSLEAYAGAPWAELLENDRVVILAEAGSGKTWEMRNQADLLVKQEKSAFFLPIEALDKEDVRGYLAMKDGEVERFDKWLVSTDRPCWFFLDAVDELKLVNGKLDLALGKLARAVGAAKNRAHILISCRPTDWRPVQDMETFKARFPVGDPVSVSELSSDEKFLAPIRDRERKTEQKAFGAPVRSRYRCVVLLPLGTPQIERFATTNGVADPKALVGEIKRREAWSFARRPLDLSGLIATWKATGKLGTLREQHERGIEGSLRDDPERSDKDVLSIAKAKEGAERVALAMMLTKHRTIRAMEQTVAASDIASIDAVEILSDWTSAEVASLLRRSIFDPATYGRVRFHHRSIQEFLAARRLETLRKKGMPVRKLLSLLFADKYGERAIIPSMRPLVAWLSHSEPDVCREALSREPEVLVVYGDPETLPLDTRTNLVRSYVDAYSGGGWRGLQMPIAEFQRLSNADLAPVIKGCWSKPRSNEEVSEFLLKLVWLGAIQDCAEIAANALVDPGLEAYTRIMASRALGECKRTDLLRIAADDMLQYPKRWPDRVVYSSAGDLFPDVITTAELEHLIRRTPEPRQTVGGFTWTMYTLVDALEPGSEAAVSLRDMLANLIWETRDKNSESWEPKSAFAHLTGALAKLCSLQMARSEKLDAALIRAAVIAHWFHGDNVVGREEITSLASRLPKNEKSRETAFKHELEVVLGIKHHEGRGLTFEIRRHSLLGKLEVEDWPWLMRTLRNSKVAALREVAFHLLADLWLVAGKKKTELEQLRKATKKYPALAAVLVEMTIPRAPNREFQKIERQQKAYADKREREQRRIEDSWANWKHKAEKTPAACFKGRRATATMWTLIHWLRQHPDAGTHLGYGNWRNVRQILGDVIGDGFERELKKYWRGKQPPIWSKRKPEERNTIWGWQHAGLTGLLVEAASGPDWSKTLSAAEAKRASEWSLVEMNGLPEWTSDLARLRSETFRAVLNTELEAEIAEVVELTHPHTLNAVRYGPEDVSRLGAPFLKQLVRKWPKPPKAAERDKENNYVRSLDMALSVIVANGHKDKAFGDLCQKRFLSERSHRSSTSWLRALCSCDLKRGILVLRETLYSLPKANRSKYAVEQLGTLFGERDGLLNLPSGGTVDAELLLELVKLAYNCVRIEDDIEHIGPYTRGPRDEAQFARDRLLNAILSLPGPEAHRAILALVDQPLFAHMKDRLRLLARERGANDSEPEAVSTAEYHMFERRYTVPPKTRDELFEVVMDRLEDIEHDIRDGDFSDRGALSKLENEPAMQPVFAKKFENLALGQYQVVREDEVADKKKPDIRLLATASEQRAVVELKIGDSWTTVELEDALLHQLVGQYLRSNNCTAGCLLITYSGRKKTFEDPAGGKRISFEELLTRLQDLASAVEKSEQHRVRLAVVGIDLRQSLPRGRRRTLQPRRSKVNKSALRKRPRKTM